MNDKELNPTFDPINWLGQPMRLWKTQCAITLKSCMHGYQECYKFVFVQAFIYLHAFYKRQARTLIEYVRMF